MSSTSFCFGVMPEVYFLYYEEFDWHEQIKNTVKYLFKRDIPHSKAF